MVDQIVLTSLFSILVMWVEHWFPWQMILRRKLPRLAAYMMGVLGILAPLTYLYCLWVDAPPVNQWFYLVALWAVVLSSGLAVVLAYLFDWISGRVLLSFELNEIVSVRDGRSIDTYSGDAP